MQALAPAPDGSLIMATQDGTFLRIALPPSSTWPTARPNNAGNHRSDRKQAAAPVAAATAASQVAPGTGTALSTPPDEALAAASLQTATRVHVSVEQIFPAPADPGRSSPPPQLHSMQAAQQQQQVQGGRVVMGPPTGASTTARTQARHGSTAWAGSGRRGSHGEGGGGRPGRAPSLRASDPGSRRDPHRSTGAGGTHTAGISDSGAGSEGGIRAGAGNQSTSGHGSLHEGLAGRQQQHDPEELRGPFSVAPLGLAVAGLSGRGDILFSDMQVGCKWL